MSRSTRTERKPTSKRNRIVSVLLWIVVILSLLLSVGLYTGKIQITFNPPSIRFSCLFKSAEECAAENSKGIDSDDTLDDGATNFTDLNGFVLNPEAGDDLPTEAEVRAMDIRAAGRFVIPSVGMDVPLNKMTVKGGTATPPGYRAAYILEGYTTGSDDPANGKTIVAMHSAMHGFAPGNYLIDEDNGKATLPNGAEVGVGGVLYRITGHEQISKKSLPDAQQVWKDEPGKLVIITCRQIGGPKTTDNTVFYGERIEG